MSGSGRDPLQKPAGYRDLETATREFTRTLEGMRSGLGTDQQAEVDNAREITNSIHSEILRLLTAGLPASSR
jgi:hypothetical protein